MAYDIYDRESANLIDSFPTEKEALAMVKQVIEEDGPASVASWVLGTIGRPETALTGKDLVARAMHTTA